MSASQPLQATEVLARLEEKEHAARERAAAADEQARLAGIARGEAEQRLARHGIEIEPSDIAEDLASAMQEDLDDELPSNRQTEEQIARELTELTRRRRELQAELQRCIAREAEVLQGLAAVESELEEASHACAESARAVIEFQKAEERARRAARSAQETATRSGRERERAESRIEQEAEAEARALERAATEESNLEQIGLERSIATRTALEQAALEEDALQRATAARAAAERAAAQRVATEQALERPAPRFVDLESTGAGDEQPRASRRRRRRERTKEVERDTAEVASAETLLTPFMEADRQPEPEGAEMPAVLERNIATAPTTTDHWFPADDDAVASDLPLDWLETEEAFELDEPRTPHGPRVPVTVPASQSWFSDDETDDDQAADSVVEAAAPQEGETEGSQAEARSAEDRDAEMLAELEDLELRRAEAELARLERSAAEREGGERLQRIRAARAVEEELDRYESAAQAEEPENEQQQGYKPLYAGQDYAWEVQAARGVQQKITNAKERAREHTPEASMEQARASSMAAEALRIRNKASNLTSVQTGIVIGLSIVLAGIGAALLVIDRPDADARKVRSVEASGAPAPPPLANAAPVLPALDSPDNEKTMNAAALSTGSGARPEALGATAAAGLLERDERSVISSGDLPAWRRYAVLVPDPGMPRISIVIDDMGIDEPASQEVIDLPGPLTVSFLPHAQRLRRQAEKARAAGHELMAHIPMEPLDVGYDPGPNYLGESMSATEIQKRLRRHLDLFDFGIVGINNHMGSRFTRNEPGMMLVMNELLKRRMMFLDSRTIAKTVGAKKAAEYGIPYTIRDVFLDHMGSPEARLEISEIKEQLRRTEVIARRNGAAIAIGHPHAETIEALREWLPGVKRRGFAIVPVTAIVRYQSALRADKVDDLADAE